MLRRFGSILLGSLIVVSSFSLTGCGQRICVAGIGDCAIQSKGNGGTQTQIGADTKFTFKTNTLEVMEDDRVEITIQNSNSNWEVTAIDGPAPIGLAKSGDFSVVFTAGKVTGASQYTKLRGKDLSRFKSETETPNAYDEIAIKIKKKTIK